MNPRRRGHPACAGRAIVKAFGMGAPLCRARRCIAPILGLAQKETGAARIGRHRSTSAYGLVIQASTPACSALQRCSSCEPA
jgi:hypothetical protein